jgi:hypothetical protein
MRCLVVSLILANGFPLLATAQSPAANGGPPVTITLGPRQARATPQRQGFCHTGGGNIDVAQPTPDTVVVTMSGVAVAGGHPCKDSLAVLTFDLVQGFEIAYDPAKVKGARLTLEGRVIGLLRSHSSGSAQQGPACASVAAGTAAVVNLALASHGVTGGDNVSVNDREGPAAVIVPAGKYTLHQGFTVSASHPHSLCCGKAASAEFAPDPALDPLWISYWEPFHGAAKKDFGFQVILKVAPETNGP